MRRACIRRIFGPLPIVSPSPTTETRPRRAAMFFSNGSRHRANATSLLAHRTPLATSSPLPPAGRLTPPYAHSSPQTKTNYFVLHAHTPLPLLLVPPSDATGLPLPAYRRINSGRHDFPFPSAGAAASLTSRSFSLPIPFSPTSVPGVSICCRS